MYVEVRDMTNIKVGDIVEWPGFYPIGTSKYGIVTKRCTASGEEVSNGRYFCVHLFDYEEVSAPVRIKELKLLT
jgi:hypothetical protein